MERIDFDELDTPASKGKKETVPFRYTEVEYQTAYVRDVVPFHTTVEGKMALHDWYLNLSKEDQFRAHVHALVQCLPPGVYLSGGAGLAYLKDGIPAGDIDLFFASFPAFQRMVQLFDNPSLVPARYRWVFEDYQQKPLKGKSYNLRALKENVDQPGVLVLEGIDQPTIQLVKLEWYASPAALGEYIDLTICRAVYHSVKSLGRTFSANASVPAVSIPEGYLEDLQQRRLVLANPRDKSPTRVLKRLHKYMERGFTPTTETIGILAQRAAEWEKDLPQKEKGDDYDTEE